MVSLSRQLSLLVFIIAPVLSIARPLAPDSCGRVTGLYVTNVTESSARIEWEPVSKSVGYIYVVSKSGIPPDRFGRFAKETTHTEKGLASGATYYAHVRTSCQGASVSDWVTVQFNTPATIDKTTNFVNNTYAVITYPVQSDRSITIKIKGSTEDSASVSLWNVLGVQIKTYTLVGDRLHIEVGSLPTGIYFLSYNDALSRLQWFRFTR